MKMQNSGGTMPISRGIADDVLKEIASFLIWAG